MGICRFRKFGGNVWGFKVQVGFDSWQIYSDLYFLTRYVYSDLLFLPVLLTLSYVSHRGGFLPILCENTYTDLFCLISSFQSTF